MGEGSRSRRSRGAGRRRREKGTASTCGRRPTASCRRRRCRRRPSGPRTSSCTRRRPCTSRPGSPCPRRPPAAEAVDAPSARQRIALSVIFVSLRGVDTSLPRVPNIRLRATGRRGRSFARLQLKISSWQGVKRRRELQIGTTDGLEVNCRAPGAARPWRVRGGNDASKSRARARCALALVHLRVARPRVGLSLRYSS